MSSDSLYLYLRSPTKKGVNIYSLEDGQTVREIRALHARSILQILVTSDNRYIITCGKDKKISVYDYYERRIVFNSGKAHKLGV